MNNFLCNCKSLCTFRLERKKESKNKKVIYGNHIERIAFRRESLNAPRQSFRAGLNRTDPESFCVKDQSLPSLMILMMRMKLGCP